MSVQVPLELGEVVSLHVRLRNRTQVLCDSKCSYLPSQLSSSRNQTLTFALL